MTTDISDSNFDLPRWLKDQCIRSPRDSAFVSGSPIEGFGNSRSDLDLYVVYEKEEDKLFKRGGSQCFSTGTVYVDLEVYSVSEIENLASQVNDIDVDDFDAVHRMSHKALDLYYRTAIGIPIWNKARFRSLQMEFDKSWLAKVLHIWAGLRYAQRFHEAEELLTHKRYEEASYKARAATESAVDSFLAANGEAFTSFKWRFEKLERIVGTDDSIYKTAWDLKVLGNRDVDTYLNLVNDFCQELGLVGFTRYHMTPNYLYKRGCSSKLFQIVDEYFIVQNRTSIYELNSTGKYVWNMLDGKTTVSDIIRKLAKKVGTTEKETRLVLNDFLRDLGRHQLLERPIPLSNATPNTTESLDVGSSNKPSVVKLPVSPAEFAITKFHTISGYALGYSLNLYDIMGAIEARQSGAAFIKCRALFEQSIDTFLVAEGKVRPNTDAPAATFDEPRLDALARIYGTSSQIYQQALKLDRSNPEFAADVEEFATRCLTFVNSVLEMSNLEAYNIISAEAWSRQNRCHYDLSKLLKFLGVRSVMTPRWAKEIVEFERTFEGYILSDT